MAGIYLHIPFCRQACNYCDFHFSTSLNNKDAFLIAMQKEIVLQKNYLEGQKINTIYFGGGTPSVLSALELQRIFDDLNHHFDIASDAEITLEANPDDLDAKKIKDLRSTPVNRFSIGIQSFSDEDLRWMNRAHTSSEAVRAVKAAQDAGFENITIDLIYGLPEMDHHRWRNNLQTAFALEVKHISSYNLTVEPGTALGHAVKTGKAKEVDEQKSAEQFEIMLEAMKNAGFIQYEISNFCKNGMFSKHNSNYWKKEHYLGLGPSAHSFNGVSRQWNKANNALYIKGMEAGKPEFEREELTIEQRYNEYVLTTLRTMWGADLSYIQNEFGIEFHQYILKAAAKYLNEMMKYEENKLFLTDKGKLFADRIASDLFKIKEEW
jgi:oxygen-independent coproporphyrinogen-3 oxidase